MVWLPDGEKSLMIRLAVSTQYRCVTDGQTSCDNIVRAMHCIRIARWKLFTPVHNGQSYHKHKRGPVVLEHTVLYNRTCNRKATAGLRHRLLKQAVATDRCCRPVIRSITMQSCTNIAGVQAGRPTYTFCHELMMRCDGRPAARCRRVFVKRCRRRCCLELDLLKNLFEPIGLYVSI